MSSPALSRSASPSLQSVADLSDIGSMSPSVSSNKGAVIVSTIRGASERGTSAYATASSLSLAPVTDVSETKPASTRASTSLGLASPQTTDPEALGVKHERYFFTADFLTFLVEGTVYRVHSFLFTMMSPLWAEKLGGARSETEEIIHLDGVSKGEMDAFLSTLYPEDNTLAKETDVLRVHSHWSAVLHLATTWKFEKQRRLAIDALAHSMTPLDKLVLARRCDVEEWLHPAFVALCMQPTALSLKDAERLSLQDVISVTSAREALRRGGVAVPTKEDASAYVREHVHAPSASASSTVDQSIEPASPPPVEHDMSGCGRSAREPSPAPFRLSECPTTEEKRKFITLFSYSDYSKALEVLEPHNIQACCDLLADFSEALRTTHAFSYLTHDVLRHSACHPSFIPVSIQMLGILLSTTLLAPRAPIQSIITQSDVKQSLQDCFYELRAFWASVEEAVNKQGDFVLGFALACSILSTDDALKMLGLRFMNRNCDQAVYNERSANLRTFGSALVEAGLLEK